MELLEMVQIHRHGHREIWEEPYVRKLSITCRQTRKMSATYAWLSKDQLQTDWETDVRSSSVMPTMEKSNKSHLEKDVPTLRTDGREDKENMSTAIHRHQE
eukprot:GHVS01036430.1.p1 GENE.GHVS01036430.1~~GHVS01036430.1.p1  ORF type:complete len:101 (+),score=11.89 GHVS01036430.1:145-447(+)